MFAVIFLNQERQTKKTKLRTPNMLRLESYRYFVVTYFNNSYFLLPYSSSIEQFRTMIFTVFDHT